MTIYSDYQNREDKELRRCYWVMTERAPWTLLSYFSLSSIALLLCYIFFNSNRKEEHSQQSCVLTIFLHRLLRSSFFLIILIPFPKSWNLISVCLPGSLSACLCFTTMLDIYLGKGARSCFSWHFKCQVVFASCYECVVDNNCGFETTPAHFPTSVPVQHRLAGRLFTLRSWSYYKTIALCTLWLVLVFVLVRKSRGKKWRKKT